MLELMVFKFDSNMHVIEWTEKTLTPFFHLYKLLKLHLKQLEATILNGPEHVKRYITTGEKFLIS